MKSSLGSKALFIGVVHFVGYTKFIMLILIPRAKEMELKLKVDLDGNQ
jgi:hypothetical protein